MDKDKMIEYLVDNESTDDLKEDLKKFYKQVEKAKNYLYENFFEEESNKWTDKRAQQVYYYLEFNNNEIE